MRIAKSLKENCIDVQKGQLKDNDFNMIDGTLENLNLSNWYPWQSAKEYNSYRRLSWKEAIRIKFLGN